MYPRIKQQWLDLPPEWRRSIATFFQGLAAVVLIELLIATEDPDFALNLASDPRLVLGALGANVLAAVVVYARKSASWTLTATLGGGGAAAIAGAFILGGMTGAPALQHGLGVDPPLVDTGDHVTLQTLDVAPPKATAYDVCLLPGAQAFNVIGADPHRELKATENKGQLNEVQYRLFFRLGGENVVIEETRAGTIERPRPDPLADVFLRCWENLRPTTVTEAQR